MQHTLSSLHLSCCHHHQFYHACMFVFHIYGVPPAADRRSCSNLARTCLLAAMHPLLHVHQLQARHQFSPGCGVLVRLPGAANVHAVSAPATIGGFHQ
jgi:hypothetical protein